MRFRGIGVTAPPPGLQGADGLDLAEEAERRGFAMLPIGDVFNDNFAILGALDRSYPPSEG